MVIYEEIEQQVKLSQWDYSQRKDEMKTKRDIEKVILAFIDSIQIKATTGRCLSEAMKKEGFTEVQTLKALQKLIDMGNVEKSGVGFKLRYLPFTPLS